MTSADSSQERVLSTLNADGSRRWLKPRPMAGRWLDRRRIVGYGLIALFVALPHVRINGRPALLVDILNRELSLFGAVLYPTDTFLLSLLLISLILSIFFFTAMFGRIWCGWACPQTVYLELVFRPIERLFDGTPGKKKSGPLSKVKGLKYPVYILLSVALAHTFLSYFVGTDALRTWIFGSPLDHPIAFLVMAGVTVAMLFDFGFFREQLCIVACPYGRFQSVMLDKDSLVVGYDRRRGEPRGRKRRGMRPQKVDLTVGETDPAPAQGDCIDCTMCVQTCPTGIDIRDGLQLECVSCTQCIDACDSIMDKIGKPRGLIRYDSQRVLEGGKRRFLRPRLFVYPTIVAVLLSVLTVSLIRREPVFVSVVRGPGAPYTLTEDGMVQNTMRVNLHDRSAVGGTYSVSVVGLEGASISFPAMTLEPGEMGSEATIVSVPREAFSAGRVPGNLEVMLRVECDSGFVTEVPALMLGPRTPGQEGE